MHGLWFQHAKKDHKSFRSSAKNAKMCSTIEGYHILIFKLNLPWDGEGVTNYIAPHRDFYHHWLDYKGISSWIFIITIIFYEVFLGKKVFSFCNQYAFFAKEKNMLDFCFIWFESIRLLCSPYGHYAVSVSLNIFGMFL